MHAKYLFVLGLSALAVASPADQKRDLGDEISSIGAAVESWASGVDDSLDSIISVLETAIPSSVLAEIETNAAAASSLASAIAAGSTPAWVTALPSNVKSALASYESEVAGVISSITATATKSGATVTGTSGSTATSGSAGATAATATATSTSTTTQSDSGAAPTGLVAMGMLGAAGILGVALAL